ncbi:MAG: MarR family transcriptional regulator [Erythrobacter sp.]
MASPPEPAAHSEEYDLCNGAILRRDLGTIAEKLAEIAAELQHCAEPDAHGGKASGRAEGERDERSAEEAKPAALGKLARHAYWLRRQRATIFGCAELFGEPAWDILLDLYIAHAEGKAVSVSSACIGSASPPTTGLRWLGVLSDEGLITRQNDASDHRRVMISLTDRGIAAMERFLTIAKA